MSLEAWVTVAAILLGPIVALMLQRWIDHMRLEKHRRIAVFRELMATRATKLSPRHVEGLNLIELEFGGWRYKKVRAAWQDYLDNLGNMPADASAQPAHFSAREELFVTLLVQMGTSLGYSFDRVAIRRNAYIPVAHDNIERDQQTIRKGVVELLEGRRGLSTLTWLMPEAKPSVEPPEPKQDLKDGASA